MVHPMTLRRTGHHQGTGRRAVEAPPGLDEVPTGGKGAAEAQRRSAEVFGFQFQPDEKWDRVMGTTMYVYIVYICKYM